MSGGKGGSTSTEIPEWLKEPLLRNITRAEAIQAQEYTPYQGPQVAAFTAPQIQAFRNIGGAAEAFGMVPIGGGEEMMTGNIPAPTEYAGGIRGYSSMPLYEQAMAKTAATPEGQANLAIREEIYSPDVATMSVNRFREQLGIPAKGEVAQQSSTAPAAMQQQYQDQQNYQRIVKQYTDEDNNTVDWDTVNAEYERRYG